MSEGLPGKHGFGFPTTLLSLTWDPHWNMDGKERGRIKLVPVYYEGLSASEVMQDLLCTCSKRNLCGTDTCSCRKNRLACVELCSCHDDDVCQNPISTKDTSDSDSE